MKTGKPDVLRIGGRCRREKRGPRNFSFPGPRKGPGATCECVHRLAEHLAGPGGALDAGDLHSEPSRSLHEGRMSGCGNAESCPFTPQLEVRMSRKYRPRC